MVKELSEDGEKECNQFGMEPIKLTVQSQCRPREDLGWCACKYVEAPLPPSSSCNLCCASVSIGTMARIMAKGPRSQQQPWDSFWSVPTIYTLLSGKCAIFTAIPTRSYYYYGCYAGPLPGTCWMDGWPSWVSKICMTCIPGETQKHKQQFIIMDQCSQFYFIYFK